MRIAIVTQPFDRVLPPDQGSMGVCTYGLAKSLSNWCEICVFGSKDPNRDLIDSQNQNPAFHFISSAASDRTLYKLRLKGSKLVNFRSPISTASWLYTDYGRKVAMAIREGRFDIVHLQHCSQYASVIREYNPKVKIALHLHAPWFSQSDFPSLSKRLEKVDLVTTVSDFVRDRVRSNFQSIADRCETIYNGIDPDEFIREKGYGETHHCAIKRILFVGAVAPHSGVHVLLDAFRLIVEEFPNVHLDIVGNQANYPIEEVFDLNDWRSVQSVARFYRRNQLALLKAKLTGEQQNGTYMEALKRKLTPTMAPKVNFHGVIKNRAHLLKHFYDADVFAFPPVCNHGFGLPPIEAMAAGTPVVASRSGALIETVVDGATGMLVPKDDAASLASSLITLLGDDARREAMGRAGRNRVFEKFTWRRAAEKTYSLYASLCLLGQQSCAIIDEAQCRSRLDEATMRSM